MKLEEFTNALTNVQLQDKSKVINRSYLNFIFKISSDPIKTSTFLFINSSLYARFNVLWWDHRCFVIQLWLRWKVYMITCKCNSHHGKSITNATKKAKPLTSNKKKNEINMINIIRA